LTIGADAAGNSYFISIPTSGSLALTFDGDHYGVILQRMDRAGVVHDLLRMFSTIYFNDGTSFVQYGYLTPFVIDTINGTITLALSTDIRNLPCQNTIGIVQILGLPKTFDTLLSFVPSGQTLAALTPGLPDGFRSADSLQAWTGNVRTLPDWSRATPLVCSAAISPSPGQLVSFSDPLPDPPI